MNAVKILNCDATEGSYNKEGKCHAVAITVGGGVDRKCDTYWNTVSKGGLLEVLGEVGACKVPSCKYNDNLLCTAPGIRVGHIGDEVDCLSFEAR